MLFKSFIDDQTVLHCQYCYFHLSQKVSGEGFFSKISTCSVRSEIKLKHMRRSFKCPLFYFLLFTTKTSAFSEITLFNTIPLVSKKCLHSLMITVSLRCLLFKRTCKLILHFDHLHTCCSFIFFTILSKTN